MSVARTPPARVLSVSEGAVISMNSLIVAALFGAVVALAALEGAYILLAPRVEPLLTLTLGLGRAVFLSTPQVALLLAGGAMLGALGGLLAKGRAEV